MNQSQPAQTGGQRDFLDILVKWALFFKIVTEEFIFGIMSNRMPITECLLVGSFLGGCILFHLDYKLFSLIHCSKLYPTQPVSRTLYYAFVMCSPFLIWSLNQTRLRQQLIDTLSNVCLASDLKNSLGKLPAFVFDRPIDDMTRRLRLKRANLPLKQFEKAKEALESGLQVYIDEIRENREAGTVDILYSHFPMPTLTEIKDIHKIPPLRFVVGNTRSNVITAGFDEVPHLLTAGQTGKGKSTLLRQLITTLYINNPTLQFTLIDLKGGLEFQLFENLPRVDVLPDLDRAVDTLQNIGEKLKSRMAFLKSFGCKDIWAFEALVKSKSLRAVQQQSEMYRHIIVIDEAAELFLAGVDTSDTSKIQAARKVLSQIARQGRAVGIHLIIATQRPDVKALDPQVKANLVGSLCFQMLNAASSITILGNGRAADLPAVAGRAIWKCGSQMVEVQVPYLSSEQAEELLEENRIQSTGATIAQSTQTPSVNVQNENREGNVLEEQQK